MKRCWSPESCADTVSPAVNELAKYSPESSRQDHPWAFVLLSRADALAMRKRLIADGTKVRVYEMPDDCQWTGYAPWKVAGDGLALAVAGRPPSGRRARRGF